MYLLFAWKIRLWYNRKKPQKEASTRLFTEPKRRSEVRRRFWNVKASWELHNWALKLGLPFTESHLTTWASFGRCKVLSPMSDPAEDIENTQIQRKLFRRTCCRPPSPCAPVCRARCASRCASRCATHCFNAKKESRRSQRNELCNKLCSRNMKYQIYLYFLYLLMLSPESSSTAPAPRPRGPGERGPLHVGSEKLEKIHENKHYLRKHPNV